MSYPEHLSSSEQRWFDLIQQCRTSGLSDSQWMQENDIKSPTFYYHVKQLRKKSCEIPENTRSTRNNRQEVVPLFIKDAGSEVPLVTNSDCNTASIRLSINDISIEITNGATQEVIRNTIASLQFLC